MYNGTIHHFFQGKLVLSMEHLRRPYRVDWKPKSESVKAICYRVKDQRGVTRTNFCVRTSFWD